ncbi:MAG: acyltransferase [Thermodesulfobacteriota bacterium]
MREGEKGASVVVRGLRFLRNWTKRGKKIARSLYYFGNARVLVHGKIYVGNRHQVKIGRRCSVNRGVVIQAFHDIRIGDGVVLSVNCMLLDGNLDHEKMITTGVRHHIPSFVHLGNYVWVGAGAIILPGVEVGDRSVVAAGAVVNRSFPEDVLIAGNPAQVVRRLKET